ncbi:MAG: hypothetical protein KatS3mg032_0969 [Cyclobacteriaceae bacterium]|nr:MAG: hypothetical protein KatS3mg032_0969 [Cyclobacteriaceae bacterium]
MRPVALKTFLSFIIAALYCCRPALQTASTGQQNAYYEDLSPLRPPVSAQPEEQHHDSTSAKPVTLKFVEPVYAVNRKVDAVLDSIDRFYLQQGNIDGYTIQVYAGTKRDEALQIKKVMFEKLPQFETEIQYNQPTFRVKTGSYFSVLEAQKDYQLIKQYFPSAILVPDKIPVKQ